MDREAKLREIQSLLARAARLERELVRDAEAGGDERPAWAPEGYYLAYHLMAGFVLGGIGALASLMWNVVGATVAGLPPLKIIQIYLTFPLGEAAKSTNNGLAIGIGCLMYLTTGAVYGMLFNYVLTRFVRTSDFLTRLKVITLLSLALWVVNFYLILSWLQPALFGGNWIVSEVPWYVGATTHLVFGWTMLVVGQWGDFERRHAADEAAPDNGGDDGEAAAA